MCDYSLAHLPNRLAVLGEQLVIHWFSGGSKGLTSPAELVRVADPSPCPRRRGFWEALKNSLNPPEAEAPVPAVCIPPGARLLLRDIPQDLQRQFGVGTAEEVTFVQQSAEAYRYRDAVRFQNGREILVQHLHCGQRVDVLCLSSDDFEEEEHQRHVEEIPPRFRLRQIE